MSERRANRNFHGFNLAMYPRGGIVRGRRPVAQNAKRNLGGEPLAIGRYFMQAYVAVRLASHSGQTAPYCAM